MDSVLWFVEYALLLDIICSSLESSVLFWQPQVSAASVNLATETAIVWPVSEAKVVPNWQKCIGETLAKQLTSCGFKSNLRGEQLLGVIFLSAQAAYHSCWMSHMIVILIYLKKLSIFEIVVILFLIIFESKD